MSWIDKIRTDLIITCGDGKEYKPQWLNAAKTKDYNIAEFEFPEVTGTLVNRKKPKGSRFELQLFFQGENHLDVSTAFEKSADDPRPWVLAHPVYGRLVVQPASLSFDNTKYNVTQITASVIETITEDYPKTSVVPQDKIANDTEIVNEALAGNAASEIETKGIKPKSVTNQKTFLEKVNAMTAVIINTASGAQEYFNAYNTALSAVDSISTAPLFALRLCQSVISAPARFEASVTSRINVLTDNLETVTDSVTNGLGVVNLMDKYLYQTNGGTIISSMCLAASLPQPADYGNRNDVLNVIDTMLDAMDTYMNTLDGLQTDNGGSPLSYIPDAAAIQQLTLLFNYTVSQLYNIALNARQERSVILEHDSNWIILAHRFYGLQADDSTITQLIANNGAGLNEMLQVRKNRKINYFI